MAPGGPAPPAPAPLDARRAPEELEPGRRYIPEEHVLIPGNCCTLLRDGVEAFPAMLDAIRSARRTVRLCTYMFFDDAVGEVFGRALAEAAGRGVDVKVLYDALGSWRIPRRFYRRLAAQGVDIRPFKPLSLRWLSGGLIRRDHRKLLTADGEVGFVGGLNVAAQWAPKGEGEGWRDDVLKIEGPAVRLLERSFRASWRMLYHPRYRRLQELRERRRARRQACSGQTALAVLSNRRSIHRAYLHAIGRARRSVLIVAAYFVPDRRMVRALVAAARRKVQVELILNGRSDHPVLHYCTRAYYDRLLEAGIRIYEWCAATLHSKTAVVDEVWGTVGSFNLERTSLRLNHEVNVVFGDPELAQALVRSFRADAAACREVDPRTWANRPWWQRVLERILYAFRKLI
jgi:cardiolipin synthase